MRDEGRTILLVTHDMGTVSPLLPPRDAARARRGRSRSATRRTIGAPLPRAQLPARRGQQVDADGRATREQRPGDDDARIVECWIEDEQGERVETCMQGRAVHVPDPGRVRARRRGPGLHDDLLQRPAGTRCSSPRLRSTSERSGASPPGDAATFSVDARLRVRARALPAGGDRRPPRRAATDVIDRWDKVLSFVVVGPDATGGLVDLPHRMPSSARRERARRASRERRAPRSTTGRPGRASSARRRSAGGLERLRDADVDDGGARVPAALLRLGARLPLAADAARCCCSASSTSSSRRRSRSGEGVAFYPVLLLTGIILYSSAPRRRAARSPSVLDRENLVRKIHFPRMVIPPRSC